MVSDEMQDYIDYLEIMDNLVSPSKTYASSDPPSTYPRLPWSTVFDNRGDANYPTEYAYRIVLQLSEKFLPSTNGNEVFSQTINMHLFATKGSEEEWEQIDNGPVQPGINYVYNDEIVIRFKDLDLESYETDGVCKTYFYIGVL